MSADGNHHLDTAAHLNRKTFCVQRNVSLLTSQKCWIKCFTLRGKVLCICENETWKNMAKRLFYVLFFHMQKEMCRTTKTQSCTSGLVSVLHVRGGLIPFLGPCNCTVIWKLRLPIESQIQLDMWGKMSDRLSRFYQAPFINLADITLTTSLEQF